MIGITLVEDLAVVVLTVLLPSLNNLTGGSFLALAIAFGKALLILIPVMFVAAKLVPPLMVRVARVGNDELYLLVVLALGFATAAITQAVGFRWLWEHFWRVDRQRVGNHAQDAGEAASFARCLRGAVFCHDWSAGRPAHPDHPTLRFGAQS